MSGIGGEARPRILKRTVVGVIPFSLELCGGRIDDGAPAGGCSRVLVVTSHEP
jgi:hypothetical protein